MVSKRKRVFVAFDNARLREYGLTAGILQNIISSTNILSSGGAINLQDERIILEPTGNYNSVDDIRKTMIPVGGGSQLVYLEDITTVSKGYIDPTKQKVRVDGKDAISLHINLKEGANVIKLGQEVDRVIEEWQSRLPVGLELSRLSSLDSYIDFKISDFINNLMQSIGIVLAVMLIFLGIRTGSIIASLIPIVTIATLMLMGMISIGLNQVTLAALIMALGMMVDNAIVVAESIMVKMEGGMEAKKAAIDSCSELFYSFVDININHIGGISIILPGGIDYGRHCRTNLRSDLVGPAFFLADCLDRNHLVLLHVFESREKRREKTRFG